MVFGVRAPRARLCSSASCAGPAASGSAASWSGSPHATTDRRPSPETTATTGGRPRSASRRSPVRRPPLLRRQRHLVAGRRPRRVRHRRGAAALRGRHGGADPGAGGRAPRSGDRRSDEVVGRRGPRRQRRTELKLIEVQRDPPALRQLAAFAGNLGPFHAMDLSADGLHVITGERSAAVRVFAVNVAAGTLTEQAGSMATPPRSSAWPGPPTAATRSRSARTAPFASWRSPTTPIR